MKPILDRLLPIPNDSGFRQAGYFVWCGSMIRVGAQYHLFASRWPEGTGNPDDLVGILDGYRLHSEIVHAVADNPMGPYRFQDVAVGGRGGHMVSTDGIEWTPHEAVKVYTHEMQWEDDTSWTATRRERPDMFNDRDGVKGSGHPTHLITGVLYQGHSWCVVQEISQPETQPTMEPS